MHTTVTLYFAAQIGVTELQTGEVAWHAHLHEHEVLIEREVLDQRTGQQTSDAVAHLGLGVHHVVRPDAFQDPTVRSGEGLGPDVGDVEVDESACGEHARFDVGADRHHGSDRVADAELTQRRLAGGVGLHDVREVPRVLLHTMLVGIDAEHLMAHLDQGVGQRRPEPAEADDHDLAVVFHRRPEAVEHVVKKVLSQ